MPHFLGEYHRRPPLADNAGKTECPSMPHAETIHIMEVMDHLRAQFGVVYPEEVESLDA